MKDPIEFVANAASFHRDIFRQDLLWTLRTLRRSKIFAVTSMIVVAVGIGATTAAFTLLDQVLLRPLPFPHGEHLAMLFQSHLANGYARTVTSPANFRDWREMSKSFESMGCYSEISVNLSGQGAPQRLSGAAITADVLKTLEVNPAIGRAFNASDERDGANVVLFSESLATALYGDAATALGRKIHLDNQVYTIVGVMPANFAFPSREAQLWTQLRFDPLLFKDPDARANLYVNVVARLHQGVSIKQAQADLSLVAKQLERTYPKTNVNVGATVIGMQNVISPQSRSLVMVVFGAAFCLMLIACTNLANLLFARLLARKKELAVRIAIGVSRERLLRQLLTENLVLAVTGGALGLLLGIVAMPMLARLVPDALPITGTLQPNLRVFAFAATVTLVMFVAFGVGPVTRASRQIDMQALRSKSGKGGRSDRVRTALVISEVVCTVTLLVVVGLLLKALWRIHSADPGFRFDNVLTLRTNLPLPKYNSEAQRMQFYNSVLKKTRELPGVMSAAYISFLPMVFGGGIFPVAATGTTEENSSAIQSSIRFVTPDFFATLDIPIRQGRDISDRDGPTAPFVAVIGESLAHRLWPGQNPIGRQLNVAFFDRTVVGVVGDISVRGFERASEPQVYLSAQQVPDGGMTFFSPKDLVVRISGNIEGLAPSLRTIIHDADPEQAISDIRPLEEIVRSGTQSRRTQLRVLSILAMIAFLLTSVGIYGLLSFAVSTCTQEVGIRLTLGAQPRDILVMFLRQGLALGLWGIVLAVPLAYLAALGAGALLFGVKPGDPVVYTSASIVALVMTLAGSSGPAIRAANVNPAITIRSE